VSAIEHVVIAAAGLGSRLGHGIPKCLVEVAGRTLIEWQLDLFRHIQDVRVVVGYMEQAVVDAVRRVNDSVIFVRNPRFRETTTQDSLVLGAAGIAERALFLDADIVFDPASMASFLDYAARRPLTIGITEAKTEFAVFARTAASFADELQIIDFSTDRQPFEWANVVCAVPGTFAPGQGAVFQTLQRLLPAPARVLMSYEIDTEADLAAARRFAEQISVTRRRPAT
jgi:GTP:adenosylcobinamide-phosphate guanylyltransferase